MLTAGSLRRALIDFKNWIRQFSIITILLLYAGALLSFGIGIFGSDEWRSGSVSKLFLLLLVIFPVILVMMSFAVQVIILRQESRDRELKYENESKFLAALEKSITGTYWHRLFLGHVIAQWEKNIENLNHGLMTIHNEYWKVCSDLYGSTRMNVQCTSSIPLEYWDPDDGDKELLRYYEKQKLMLISRRIPVTRTFILPVGYEQDGDYQKRFLDIATRHLNDGFHVFYVDLDSVEEEERELVKTDCALIDNRILLVGRQSEDNRMVYFYEFYDLEEAYRNYSLFERALKIFQNPTKLVSDQDPQPLFKTKRMPINNLPWLNQTSRIALDTLVQRLGNYGTV